MSSTISVVLLERDPDAARPVTELLEIMGFPPVATIFCIRDALNAIYTHRPDIVILNIDQCNGEAVLEFGRTISQHGKKVILTAPRGSTDLMERIKTFQPAAFLVKPLERFSLQSAIELAHARNGTAPAAPADPNGFGDVVFIKCNNVIQKVRLQDILYVSAEGNYSTIVTASKRMIVKMSLAQIQDMLRYPEFLQVHRNFLVRIHEIDHISLSNNELSIRGHTLPISRQKFRDDLLKNVRVLK